MERLKSFRELVGEMAEKYGLQPEIVESIITEYLRILYFCATDRDIGSPDPIFDQFNF